MKTQRWRQESKVTYFERRDWLEEIEGSGEGLVGSSSGLGTKLKGRREAWRSSHSADVSRYSRPAGMSSDQEEAEEDRNNSDGVSHYADLQGS